MKDEMFTSFRKKVNDLNTAYQNGFSEIKDLEKTSPDVRRYLYLKECQEQSAYWGDHSQTIDNIIWYCAGITVEEEDSNHLAVYMWEDTAEKFRFAGKGYPAEEILIYYKDLETLTDYVVPKSEQASFEAKHTILHRPANILDQGDGFWFLRRKFLRSCIENDTQDNAVESIKKVYQKTPRNPE